jgi:hypothetical protein
VEQTMSDNQQQIDELGEALDSNPAMVDEAGETGLVAEEKKPFNRTTLVLFAFMLIGAGGIYFMRARTAPQSAEAATAQTVAAKAAIDKFLSDGGKNIKAMQDMIRNTEKVVERFAAFPSAAQIPVSDLKTDPFGLAPKTKSTETDVDTRELERQRMEKQRQQMLASVGQLQLQSILYGDTNRSCMINNGLYKVGQKVEGFSVEQISQNSVIVKNGVYRFELRMQK